MDILLAVVALHITQQLPAVLAVQVVAELVAVLLLLLVAVWSTQVQVVVAVTTALLNLAVTVVLDL